MPTEYTPALNLAKPEVNGADTENTWGFDINANFDKLDAALSPEAIDDQVASLLQAGTNVALHYNDVAGTLRIDADVNTGGGFIGGLSNFSNSRNEAALTNFDAEVKALVLLGALAPGDAGPPMPCKRTNGPVTAHAGWFRSADRYKLDGTEDATNGGYWEYRGRNQPIWIEWFGGKGDYYIVPEAPPYTAQQVNPTPTDNRAAFHNAVKFFYSWINYVGAPGQLEGVPLFSAGPTIQLGYGAYYCSDELVPDRGITMQGMGIGMYHDGTQSQFVFPAGKRGLLANSVSSFVPGMCTGIVRNIFFRCLGHAGQTDKHGLVMKMALTVEHCTFHNFGGDGINIVNYTGTSNANCFYLAHNVIYSNAGHGIYCLGPESNAGSGYSNNVMSNGGWGIRDDSFLGNFFYGGHESYNEGGPYWSNGINGRGVFLGNYNEGYHTPSYCGPNAHFIGGMLASGVTVASGGSAWIYNTMYPFRMSSQAAGHNIEVLWGHGEIANLIYAIQPAGAFENQRFMYTPGYYMHTYGYVPGRDIAYAITTDAGLEKSGRQTPIPRSRMFFPDAFYLGGDRLLSDPAEGKNRHIGYYQSTWWGILEGLSYPGREYLKGDIWFNTEAFGTASGGYAGEICVQSGVHSIQWVSGREGHYDPNGRHGGFTKNAAGHYYRIKQFGAPGTPSTSEPTHTTLAGDDVAYPDGYKWQWLGTNAALFKRFAPLMGATSTTVNDPIFNVSQTWNDAAVAFQGNQTHITDTASHADSELETWAVNGVRKAAIRKDGTFMSNGVPVVLLTQFDELRETIATLQARVTELEAING